MLEHFQHAKEFGIIVGDVKADFPRDHRSAAAASPTRSARASRSCSARTRSITIAGTAKLLPRAGAWKPHQIEVDAERRQARRSTTKHVIIATGARARSLPGIELDGKRIIEYRKAMTLPEQPKSMVVLGAGAIGVEFASFYRSLGTEVTIVEFMPRLVPERGSGDQQGARARVRQARHQARSSVTS